MDATPLTLGQEFSGYASQIGYAINTLKNTLPHLAELPIGGTAVGTGINAPKNFDKQVVSNICKLTKLPFTNAKNKFEAQASRDCLVEVSSALKTTAVSLMLVTALSNYIGYANAAKISKKAHMENKTLKQAALELDLVTKEQFDEWVDPKKMLGT